MLSNELLEIMGPAFAAGIMIALTHAPLGIEVLRRGIIFIDLAVAQIAGLGLIAATTYFHEPQPWLMQLIALAGALAAGLAFHHIERLLPHLLEAIIGCSFVLAASLALLLLADQPHGGEEIQHLLSGQILFLGWNDVFQHVPVYGFILAAWFIKPVLRKNWGFFVLFALAITSSVQLGGVYVVFASLILPALAAVGSRTPLLYAWGCGIGAMVAGLVLSILTDNPAGPLIVCSYAAMAGGIACSRMLLTYIRCAENRTQKRH